jgi:4a-hydroxytetrahydrobiopterin dehydratase
MGYVAPMPLLERSVIEAFVADHPDWSVVDGEITKTFTFRDFNESMGFVNRVAEAAESASHHPDIIIKWNRVTLTLSTHSEGGLTGKDLALATAVESL